MKLSEIPSNQCKKILVYGDSGTGKTVFASSTPGPVWIADFDGKTTSAAAFWKEHNPEKLNGVEVELFTPQASEGGLSVFRKFEERLNRLEQLGAEGKFPFKTIVIDSLTTFSDSLLQLVIAENPGVKRFDPKSPAMQDYGIMAARFVPLLSRILALPCNVVMTAHIKEVRNEQTGELTYKPMLAGQLPERVPILFEEVYRSFVETKDNKSFHVAQTRPDFRYKCRTQIPTIPQYVPLNWRKIEEYMNSKGDQK